MVKHEVKKITHYEYWAWWIYYFPLIPLYLWYSLKAKSLMYFTAVNPTIHFGGLFNYSKFNLQKKLPRTHRPIHELIPTFKRKNYTTHLSFPLVAKPEKGERGRYVQIIQDSKSLNNYLDYCDQDILLQEFIDKPLEFGLFYARNPKEKTGKIISITAKRFLTFEGDGKTSLREFIESDSRAYFNKSYLYMKYHHQQELILPKGERMLLEPIGNHNRGTYFYDRTDLITDELEIKLNDILADIDGFYFGRLDVKTDSIACLQRGDFVVLEVNGANSEATHVYDKKYNLIQSYKEVIRHLKVQFKIAKINLQSGVKPAKLGDFLSEFFQYMKRLYAN